MCNERENLVAYLYDEVDAVDRRNMDAHLLGCETCREELRAFRGVRQDLLAWDVPAHESVWKPFVTARPQPVWRQVPAWSLAVAATLVFAIGGAGGFAGRALAARSNPPAPIAAGQPVVERASVTPTASPAATTAAMIEDLRALQARLGEVERAASARAVSPAPVSMSASSDAVALSRVEQLIRESEGRLTHSTTQKIMSIISDLGRQQKADKALLLQQISDTQEQINSNILRVMNSRGPEKEKEQ